VPVLIHKAPTVKRAQAVTQATTVVRASPDSQGLSNDTRQVGGSVVVVALWWHFQRI